MRALLASLVLPLLACAPLVASDPTVDPRIPLGGEFVPFGMCMADLSPADQVATCLKAGYQGLGVTGMDAETLHTYALPSPGTASYDRHLERSLARWHDLVVPR